MSIQKFSNWAKSAEGRSIELFSSEESLGNKNPILFIGGVHGDEPEGVCLADELLEWFKSSESSWKTPWVLIPCLNPDGYRSKDRCNGNQVDLNRNFPAQNWSSEAKAPRYNPGPKPGSEPETKALIELIDLALPKLIIHFHSWKPCIVYTGEPAKECAEILGKSSRYEVLSDIGYQSPGSLGDYGWMEKKIPVICIEEQEDISLQTIWPRFKNGLIEIVSGQGLSCL